MARIPTFDGLRGAAAIGVFLYHVGAVSGRQSAFSDAYIAVDLFFLLSGFVIASAYEGRMAETRSPIGDMLIVRFIRFFPMIALGSVLGFIAAETRAGWTPDWAAALAFLKGLLLTPTIAPHAAMFPLDVVEWSLFFELLANLLHAALLRHLSIVPLVGVAGAGFVALILTGGLHQMADDGLGSVANAAARVTFAYPLGIVLYRLARAERLQLPAAPGALLVLIAAAALAAPTALGAHAAAAELVVVAAAFPVICALGSTARMGHAAARLSAIAGDLSYALYAIQVPLTWLFTVIVVSRLNSEPLRIAAWLLFVPAVVGLAWLATDIIDRPARRWLSGFYKPMRPVAAAATA